MGMATMKRPNWSKPFIKELEDDRHSDSAAKVGLPIRALAIALLSLCGLAIQLFQLSNHISLWWVVASASAWVLNAVYMLAVRPRRFHLLPSVFLTAILASQCTLLIRLWHNTFDLQMRLVAGNIALSIIGVTVIVNMPMRHPGSSRFGISKPYSMPNDKYRSPEDNITFWQWMTISWVAPLLTLAKQRQLNEADIWLLPYEFQHRILHNTFRRLQGSVLRRLLVANWIDLAILSLLEFVELTTKYSEPILLQKLLAAMQRVHVEKRPALTYAGLTLLVRCVNAQSVVFSLWYGRRCYERSRGEMMTMLYEKTLHRKVIAKSRKDDDQEEEIAILDRVNTTQSSDERTPLLGERSKKELNWWQRAQRQLRMLWTNFKIAIKGVDKKNLDPADLGRIMNLIRNDAYEVAQRFWDFQQIIEKPIGLVLSLILTWRLMGWSSIVAVGVVVAAQVINYLLAVVDVRFEKAIRKARDKRLQQTSQYIESIRHLRWYGWQNYWLMNVFKARQRELNLRLVTYIWTLIIIFNNVFSSSLVIVAAFWAYTVLAGRPLSIDIIFPALQVFQMVQDNMGEIPDLIQTWLKARVALQRIQMFMEEPNKEDLFVAEESNEISDRLVKLQDASFAWPGLPENVLNDLNVTFGPGFNVISGEVASGKSALLQAILGELDARGGRLVRPSTAIAYCSQTPWLQSMTIRDNILFNSAFELDRYKKTIRVCALLPDLASFEKGDLSAIGENGIGLSGGQKARVALARAIYSRANVLMLDDPLSALDQQTSEYIVAQCFQGDLLKGRTVILVTHRTDLCAPIATQIVKMSAGRAEAVQQEGVPRPSTNGVLSSDSILDENHHHKDHSVSDAKLFENAIPDKFEDEEHRAHGDIRASVYWEYVKAGNVVWWALVILGTMMTRGLLIAANWYLKEFGEAYGRSDTASLWAVSSNSFIKAADAQPAFLRRFFESLPSPLANVRPWLMYLLILYAVEATSLIFTYGATVTTRYLAGQKLFQAVMRKVSGTYFRYYDVTPTGRLMNRLTSDMGQVDAGVGSDIFRICWAVVTWIASVVVIASMTPTFLLVCALLSVVYVAIFMHFLPTSQSLRRLETVSLSPLFTNFGALLAGLTTVRAYRAEESFQDKLIKVVDIFQGMDHFYWSVQAWLTYRLELMSALSTLLLTVIAIYSRLSAGLTAFMLINAHKFVVTTDGLCKLYGRLQVNFVSVERVVELLDLEQEPTNPVPPPAWWPSYGGSIIFENVTIRYAPHLEPALVDISLELKGGTNTAVVGRTGSGKSTLAASLLATVPVEKGRILIDGVDLSTVDRQALRSRVTFLAQEPVLFEGTLRHNLDPTKSHSDSDCINVITRCCSSFGWTLSTQIEPGGKNLSQGQRQLVGLARAILRRSSIIIMDEATASIDVETAWEIQRVLREELKSSTVITIAHRTGAVRDADFAVVLKEGKVKSFGPAREVVGVVEGGEDEAEGEGGSGSASGSGSGSRSRSENGEPSGESE